MLEVKFAVYYRESQAFFKHSPPPTVFLIQQSCVIITFRC